MLFSACLHVRSLFSDHDIFLSCWTQKEAYGEASSDSSDDEEWSGKNTPIKSNEEGEADSPAGKGSSVVHHNNDLTTQSTKKSLHSLHGSVDEKHGDLTSNGSNSTARKGHFGPVVNQVSFMIHYNWLQN
jgi:hypothetical protein